VKTAVCFSVLLLFAIFPGCDQKKVDTTAVKEEMKEREIRKITSGEISERLKNAGTSLSAKLEFCSASHSDLKFCLDSLQKTEKARFKVIPLNSSSSNYFTGKKQMVFDAYLYNKENNLPLENNVQFLENDSLLFTKPLTLKNMPADSAYVLFYVILQKDLIMAE
jgi:hypothetical protein